MIVSGFPCIGKSKFYKQYPEQVADSDSSLFSWSSPGVRNPDFPKNYIEHIKSLLDTKEIILVSSHKVVRDALVENELNWILVHPDRSAKDEYLHRAVNRGSPFSFVDMLDKNWDIFITEMEEEKRCIQKITLCKEAYLNWVIVVRQHELPSITLKKLSGFYDKVYDPNAI